MEADIKQFAIAGNATHKSTNRHISFTLERLAGFAVTYPTPRCFAYRKSGIEI